MTAAGKVTVDRTEEFSAHRDHLRAVAYRMLGSAADADDAVQEAWLRWARTGGGDIRDTRAWLTTVVSRICLDILRTRTARREVPLTAPLPAGLPDPESEAALADSVGLALLVVLDTLTPAERLAFVLHDLFGLPFAEIAPILDRSVPATKMLASRARRRVRAAPAPPAGNRPRQLVEAFLAASRNGDFTALVALLDPGVVVRADLGGSQPIEARGAQNVARQALVFAHRAAYAHIEPIDGVPAIVVRPPNAAVLVMRFSFADASSGRITAITITAAKADAPNSRSEP